MINIYYNDEDINYVELYELVKSFYPYDEIRFTNSLMSEEILISISIEKDDCYALMFSKGICIEKEYMSISETNIFKDFKSTKKITVKKTLYKLLNKISKNHLPWGILTGIKPVKIPSQLLKLGIETDAIKDILINQYYIASDKANLALITAINQNKAIKNMNENSYSLYIHIPFCPSRCSYCAFPSLTIDRYKNIVNDYMEKLNQEVKVIGSLMRKWHINTIYIGGGTPTSIASELLEELLINIRNLFPTVKELTVEAGRPETLDFEKLIIMKKYGVNRISINPQTMNDDTLRRISRSHTSDDVIIAYKNAKEIGIETVNMDLIIGLPGESLVDIKNTLDKIAPLKPDNLTIHALSLKKGSKLIKDQYINMKSIKMIEEMQNECIKFAYEHSLKPYYLYRQKMIAGNLENIGFSMEDNPCIYNISMMEEKETIIGCGMGATSKFYNRSNDNIGRFVNPKDINLYFERFQDSIIKIAKMLEF